MAIAKDFQNQIKPNWCPGCGDYAVQTAIQRALANLGREPHQVALIAGIGCSGRISGYIHTNGFHGIHGRSLPIAQGVKMANRELTVIAAGGDGDGFAIGTGHTIHALRRNLDLTYIVMDNHIYGLTKGQASPRTEPGTKTKTTPHGAFEQPLSALRLALAAGATFVAQGFSKEIAELTSLIEAAVRHPGFAFVNVFSPCVTYNKEYGYDWFSRHIVSLKTLDGYDPASREGAMSALFAHDDLVTGLIYRDPQSRSYQERLENFSTVPLAHGDLSLPRATFERLLGEFG